MVGMKKLIEFKDLDKAIQEYADLHCEGNFSLAVRQLLKGELSNGKASNDNLQAT